jgi:hypothetical protein
MRAILVMLVACSSPLRRALKPLEHPQTPPPTGALSGHVDGEGVAARAVTVLAGSQATLTDENGNYALELPPGNYSVTFYYANAAVTADATITIGQTTTVSAQLKCSEYETVSLTRDGYFKATIDCELSPSDRSASSTGTRAGPSP